MTADFTAARNAHTIVKHAKVSADLCDPVTGRKVAKKAARLRNGMLVSLRAALAIERMTMQAEFLGRPLDESEARAMFTRDVYLTANRRTEDETPAGVIDYARTIGVVR